MRDFAHVDGAEADRPHGRRHARWRALEVDAAGLDAMDRRYLSTIAVNFGGGPVGVETIAAALSEPRDAIEDIIEPYLIQQGFVQRTPRGRLLTGARLPASRPAEPARDPAQFGLFAGDEERIFRRYQNGWGRQHYRCENKVVFVQNRRLHELKALRCEADYGKWLAFGIILVARSQR